MSYLRMNRHKCSIYVDYMAYLINKARHKFSLTSSVHKIRFWLLAHRWSCVKVLKLSVWILDLSASASSEEEKYPPELSSNKKLALPAKEVPAANDSVIVNCEAVVHLPNTSLTDLVPIRHSSPYYYGDLFKPSDPLSSRTHPSKYRKSLSLNEPEQPRCQTVGAAKRNSLTEKNLPHRFQLHDLLSPICPAEDAVLDNSDLTPSCMVAEWDPMLMPPQQFLNYDLRGKKVFYDEQCTLR